MKPPRNLLIDNYRRTKSERVTDSIEDQLPMLEERTAVESRTDSMLAGREAGEVLQAALVKLSPELRETVILRDLEGLEYKEIAGALKISFDTVHTHVRNVYEKLHVRTRTEAVTKHLREVGFRTVAQSLK